MFSVDEHCSQESKNHREKNCNIFNALRFLLFACQLLISELRAALSIWACSALKRNLIKYFFMKGKSSDYFKRSSLSKLIMNLNEFERSTYNQVTFSEIAGGFTLTSFAGPDFGTSGRCLIMGGNGNDRFPSRYYWSGSGKPPSDGSATPYCGFNTASDLVNNKQAVWWLYPLSQPNTYAPYLCQRTKKNKTMNKGAEDLQRKLSFSVSTANFVCNRLVL